MLDADTFLKNSGQRGQQLTVLPPGKYRLNRYLWDVEQRDAKEVPAGFVGVVKSNVCADIDFGTLERKKPEKCDVILNRDNDRAEIGTLRASKRRSFRSGAPACGTSRCSPASTTSIRTPSRSPRSIRARRSGPMPAATSGPRSRSRSMPRATSCKAAPRTRCRSSKDNADRAVFVKMEGWDVPLELRVVAQVSPAEAHAWSPASARSKRWRTAC